MLYCYRGLIQQLRHRPLRLLDGGHGDDLIHSIYCMYSICIKDNINSTEETKYAAVDRFDICFSYCFFLNIESILLVTTKPPKILTAANPTATKPKYLDIVLSMGPAAKSAPTIITDEIALVTPIKGL